MEFDITENNAYLLTIDKTDNTIEKEINISEILIYNNNILETHDNTYDGYLL
jgi:hypothetical protein